MWRVYRSSGRPWPQLHEDEVIDYMVMEAVSLKVKKQDEQARKEAERTAWKEQQKERLKQASR